MDNKIVTPLMVRSFGRSGSTLMMEILMTSRNILMENKYPFENRYLSYLARMALLIGNPCKNDADWNQDSIMGGNLRKIGGLPYPDIELFNKEELVNFAFRGLWNQFGQLLKKNGSFNDEQPVYYAEKVAHGIVELVNKNLIAKNIFLLRDPRDEFLSIKSFNEKRKSHGFGWTETDTDASFAERHSKSKKGFMSSFISIGDNEDRRIKIRYEDLIVNPNYEIGRLAKWLGVSLNYQQVLDNRSKFSHHMTSSTPEESVGKWRSDMGPDILEIYEGNLGEELRDLSY